MATVQSMEKYVNACKAMDPNVKVVVGNNRHLSFVCYSLRREADGSINTAKPFRIYWRTFTGTHSKMSKLNMFDKSCTYGIKVKELDSWWRLKLISYKDRTMYLNKQDPHKLVWNCQHTNSPPEELPELSHLFVEESDSMFKLTPKAVFVVGTNNCGATVERINP
jgi:hypothetical protein